MKLEGSDPIRSLVGLRVPDRTRGVGLVVNSRHRAANPDVRSFTVVGRSGAALTEMWRPTGPRIAAGRASGLVVDVMCRLLGVATEPPANPLLNFWLTHWLTETLRARAALAQCSPGLARSGRAITLDELLHHHPSIAWNEALPAVLVELAEFCAERLLDYSATSSWEDVREGVIDGRFVVPGIEASAAEWFDEGSFARWVALRGVSSQVVSSAMFQSADDEARYLLTNVLEMLFDATLWETLELPDLQKRERG